MRNVSSAVGTQLIQLGCSGEVAASQRRRETLNTEFEGSAAQKVFARQRLIKAAD
jgi:hypothetical protein